MFAFTFLSPTAGVIALSALAIPIIFLYLLKLRRTERVVSSSLLWREAVEDMMANAPFQRLRKNLLLILQLLFLLIAILALLRPAVRGVRDAGLSIAVVIDASASMKAIQEDGRTRFEFARGEVLKLIDNLRQDGSEVQIDEMMVVSAGGRTTLRQPFTRDVHRLRKAILQLDPTDAATDLGEAVSLAAAAVKDRPKSMVYVFSDGAVPPLPKMGTSASRIRFVRCGDSAENVGILMLDSRLSNEAELLKRRAAGESLGSRLPYEVFVRIRNFSDTPHECFLSLYHGDEIVGARKLTIPANQELQELFHQDLPAGVLRADLEVEDALDVDNRAWCVLDDLDGVRLQLVTYGNPVLERALSVDPMVTLEVTSPDAYKARQGFDAIILDGDVPATLPTGNLIVFGADRDVRGIKPAEEVGFPTILDWRREHPVLRYVSLLDVHLMSAVRPAEGWRGEALVRASGGSPLMIYAREGGGFTLWVGWQVLNSDWPLRASFKVFWLNVVKHIRETRRLDLTDGVRPGAVIPLAVPPGETWTIKRPGGAPVVLDGEAGRGVVPFSETEMTGEYRITRSVSGTNLGAGQPFVLNLFNEAESNIEPRETLSTEGGAIEGQTDVKEENREIWPYFAIAALLIGMGEWYCFHRRIA